MGCGRSLEKEALLRLVRADDGAVRADSTGSAEGRGAYVCGAPACADKVGEGRPLARSFRAPVTVRQETIDFIREWQRSASTR